jgi:hypothetical protein
MVREERGMIKAGDKVTKKGDSLDNPTVGKVKRVSGNRAEVDWGFTTGWDTLHSLVPHAEAK